MIEVTTIDDLTRECGHHTMSRTNNGYGCRHPDVESRDDQTGEGQCFTFSCPLGHALYPESDPEDYKWLADNGHSPEAMTDEGNWMILDKESRRVVRLPICRERLW